MSEDTLDVQPGSESLISLDDSFRFSCTRCGECCFDQLVLLDPLDIFYLSRAQERATQQLFDERFVELTECDGEWRCALVMPRFRKGTKCRFLDPRLTDAGKILSWGCSLHTTGAKPLVCLSSPVARDVEGNFYLVAPVSSCPGMDRGQPQRLGDYLSLLRVEHRQRFSRWFHQELRPQIKTREQAGAVYCFPLQVQSVPALEGYLTALALSWG